MPLTTIFSVLPAAMPAGMEHSSWLPLGTAHVAGDAGNTCPRVRLAGKVSVRVMMPVVAPVPVLATASVHVSASPTLILLLSTLLCTATCGLKMVVLV